MQRSLHSLRLATQRRVSCSSCPAKCFPAQEPVDGVRANIAFSTSASFTERGKRPASFLRSAFTARLPKQAQMPRLARVDAPLLGSVGLATALRHSSFLSSRSPAALCFLCFHRRAGRARLPPLRQLVLCLCPVCIRRRWSTSFLVSCISLSLRCSSSAGPQWRWPLRSVRRAAMPTSRA